MLKFLATLTLLSAILTLTACSGLTGTPTSDSRERDTATDNTGVMSTDVVPTVTPDVVPTATPQPTWTPQPTYTPQPTWTPFPTPTPTPTPLPTPTPTLRQYAEQNAGNICLNELPSIATAGSNRGQTINREIREVIADTESGEAFVKLTSQLSRGPTWHYFRYQPGPVYGTGACKRIDYREYPLPEQETVLEERIKQVAAIADEICQAADLEDWGYPPEDIRATTEVYALVMFGKYKSGRFSHYPPERIGNGYAVYNIETNTCEEVDWASTAWHAWPDILTPTPQP